VTVAVVRRETLIDLAPEQAFELWTDPRRWPTFVDGFARLEQVDGEWPAPGAKLVWQSTPAGKGRVSEKVIASEPPLRFATRVVEPRSLGTQSIEFMAIEEGGTCVELVLDYQLTTGGPLRAVTDLLFIRRAQGDALTRTLRRFAIEAAEQAAL
jgi:uncharacterized membrane protein